MLLKFVSTIFFFIFFLKKRKEHFPLCDSSQSTAADTYGAKASQKKKGEGIFASFMVCSGVEFLKSELNFYSIYEF
jgi:hypothetical protein